MWGPPWQKLSKKAKISECSTCISSKWWNDIDELQACVSTSCVLKTDREIDV